MRFPNVIIAGAKKCGTTTLQAFLSMHSMLAVVPEEVHYFDRMWPDRDLSWYLHRMPEVPDHKILLEKTPAYFVTPTAPREIAQVNLDHF